MITGSTVIFVMSYLEDNMGAFDGIRIPYDRTCEPTVTEESPSSITSPSMDEWCSFNSNQPYEYPWGKKHKNPFFIGPYLPCKTKEYT